jgi:predicted deacylase
LTKPKVELLPVDITPFAKGNTDIPYVTTFDSGVAGPHVVVNALTHGNELCGAHALTFLFEHDVRPARGKLTLSFANTAAYHAFDAANPTASRYIDEDMNRLWTPEILDGDTVTVERLRARELRPLIEEADFLLDIHSMQSHCAALMLCGTKAKGRRLAQAIGVPKFVVADAGHTAGRRMRDYGAFDDENSPKTALLVECGQHWERASADVAVETAVRFLQYLDVVDGSFAAGHLSPTPEQQKLIEVTAPHTITNADFKFVTDYRGLEVIPQAGTVIALEGGAPVVTPYDDCVLIMPSQRINPGQTAVRFGGFAS